MSDYKKKLRDIKELCHEEGMDDLEKMVEDLGDSFECFLNAIEPIVDEEVEDKRSNHLPYVWIDERIKELIRMSECGRYDLNILNEILEKEINKVDE